MLKTEFVRSIRECRLVLVKDIADEQFVCNLLNTYVSYDARDTFQELFNPNERGYNEYRAYFSCDVRTDMVFSDQKRVDLRLTALDIFEQICLDNRQYLNF